MIAFIQGIIKIIDTKSFQDKEGTQVEYNTVYVQTIGENGQMEVVELNTKRDLTAFIDKPVEIKLSVRNDTLNPKLKKVAISDVREVDEA